MPVSEPDSARVKRGILLRFLFHAVLCAALFGALNDQVSVSLSPEYYSAFKFEQFHLTRLALPLRLKASLVGVLASWWMGLLMGAVMGIAAWRLPVAMMRRVLYRCLPLMLLVAAIGAGIGVWVGAWRTGLEGRAAFARWWVPSGVQDVRAFLTVAAMHLGAYAGGGVALVAGVLQILRARND